MFGSRVSISADSLSQFVLANLPLELRLLAMLQLCQRYPSSQVNNTRCRVCAMDGKIGVVRDWPLRGTAWYLGRWQHVCCHVRVKSEPPKCSCQPPASVNSTGYIPCFVIELPHQVLRRGLWRCHFSSLLCSAPASTTPASLVEGKYNVPSYGNRNWYQRLETDLVITVVSTSKCPKRLSSSKTPPTPVSECQQ